MTTIVKKARDFLGPLRDNIFDSLIYNRKMNRAIALRGEFRNQLPELTPLPEPENCICEVHMLCGKRDLDMGIWASWSLMRFFPGRSRLFVHSDGSLAEENLTLWRKVLPGTTLVTRKEAEDLIVEKLGIECKDVVEWRCDNILKTVTPQLVDVHLVGSAKKLLLMDSDVLCFRDPIEVREALVCEEPCYRWCKGIRAAYCGQLDFLRNLAGASLPDELCAGFMVVPRFGVADFRKLQSLLETVRRDGRMPLDHWWTPQTFYALMAAGSSDARPLPPPYSNRLGKGDTEMKLRHYVGIKRVRHRYFTEGIPRLLTAKQSLP